MFKCVYLYSCVFVLWMSGDIVDGLLNDRINDLKNIN